MGNDDIISENHLYAQLISQKKDLTRVQTKLEKEERENEQLIHVLSERVKELNCHKQLSILFAREGLKIEKVFNRLLEVIQSSWQFPEITEVSIELHNESFQTKAYKSSKFELTKEITLSGKKSGTITIGYPNGKFSDEENVFKPEERDLLQSIAERLGNYLLRLERAKKLKESVATYHQFLETIPDALLTCNLSGRIKYNSKKSRIMFGYPEYTAFKGKSIFEFFVGTEHTRVAMAVEDLLTTGSMEAIEFTGLKSDGNTFPVELLGEVIMNNEGNPQEILYSIRDISKTKRLEENLVESERMLSNMMNNLPGLVYRCLNDKVWTMIFMSKGCKDLTGYPSEAFLGDKAITYNDIVYPDDRVHVSKTVDYGLKSGNSFEIKYRIITSEGEIKKVWEKGWGVIDKGRVFYLEGIVMDISDVGQFRS